MTLFDSTQKKSKEKCSYRLTLMRWHFTMGFWWKELYIYIYASPHITCNNWTILGGRGGQSMFGPTCTKKTTFTLCFCWSPSSDTILIWCGHWLRLLTHICTIFCFVLLDNKQVSCSYGPLGKIKGHTIPYSSQRHLYKLYGSGLNEITSLHMKWMMLDLCFW